jgi:hypothetical protein
LQIFWVLWVTWFRYNDCFALFLYISYFPLKFINQRIDMFNIAACYFSNCKKENLISPNSETQRFSLLEVIIFIFSLFRSSRWYRYSFRNIGFNSLIKKIHLGSFQRLALILFAYSILFNFIMGNITDWRGFNNDSPNSGFEMINRIELENFIILSFNFYHFPSNFIDNCPGSALCSIYILFLESHSNLFMNVWRPIDWFSQAVNFNVWSITLNFSQITEYNLLVWVKVMFTTLVHTF